MAPITVLVRLTGLLLFASGPGENAPTYVLFPTTSSVESHVAQIGFRQSVRTAECDDYQNRFGEHICYVNIANTSITLGRPGNAMRTTLPRANVSAAANQKIAAGHFNQAQVPESLHARLILNEGQNAGECALGLYRFAGDSEVAIPNVVHWRFTHPDGPSLTITATPLRAGATRREFPVIANDDGILELFVRYVPASEQNHVDQPPQLPTHPEEAVHYLEFYKLLEMQPGRPEAPLFTGRNPRTARCVWMEAVRFERFTFHKLGQLMSVERPVRPTTARYIFDSSGTLTCTVGKGDPPSTGGS